MCEKSGGLGNKQGLCGARNVVRIGIYATQVMRELVKRARINVNVGHAVALSTLRYSIVITHRLM
jgi:hypothetical protein